MEEICDAFGVIDAIIAAADNGSDVINISIGGQITLFGYMFFSDAISYANDKGATVVVSAGNDSKDVSNVVPASVMSAITVASIDESGNPSDFSNFGAFVDVSAPGRKVTSSIPYYNNLNPVEGSYNEHYYAKLNGTSMAAPFVSAASAMLKTINTEYTPSEIQKVIKMSSYKPDSWNENYGTGIVDFVSMSSYTKTKTPTIKLTSEGAVLSASPKAKIYYTTDGSIPIEGESPLYNGTPVNTMGVKVIKAIACADGELQSNVATKQLRWTIDVKVRYKGTAELPLASENKIEKVYSSDENIVNMEGDGNIRGVSVGKATLTVYFENNQVGTYNVSVEYAWWQWFIRIFLFGFLWY